MKYFLIVFQLLCLTGICSAKLSHQDSVEIKMANTARHRWLMRKQNKEFLKKKSGWIFSFLAAFSWAGFMAVSSDSLPILAHLVWTMSATVSALVVFRSASTLEIWIKQLVDQ